MLNDLNSSCTLATSDIFIPHINFFRRQYLSHAVLQAKNSSNSDGVGSTHGAFDDGLLDLLEGKLAVLGFQIKIKKELEVIASKLEATPSTSESAPSDLSPDGSHVPDANFVHSIREKVKEVSLDLKSITQLYNEYAVPLELWEVYLLPSMKTQDYVHLSTNNMV